MMIDFSNVVNEDAINKLSDSELNALYDMLREKIENYPDFYGIPGIKFHYINEWSDPEIIYKGRRCSMYCIEDTMWDRWIHDDDGNHIPEKEDDEEGFIQFMRENRNEVYELCELMLFPEEVAV